VWVVGFGVGLMCESALATKAAAQSRVCTQTLFARSSAPPSRPHAPAKPPSCRGTASPTAPAAPWRRRRTPGLSRPAPASTGRMRRPRPRRLRRLRRSGEPRRPLAGGWRTGRSRGSRTFGRAPLWGGCGVGLGAGLGVGFGW